MPPRIIRTKFLVRKFQLKFAGFVLLLMAIVGLICGFIVYNSGATLLVEKLSNVYPQHRLVAILKAVNARLVVGFLLAIPFIFISSVIVSHRIAGPLVRIERSLNEIGDGNLALIVKLRQSDELQDLAKTINDMVLSIKEKVKGPKELASQSHLTLEPIKAELTKSQPDVASLTSQIGELENQLNSLKEGLSKFTIS